MRKNLPQKYTSSIQRKKEKKSKPHRVWEILKLFLWSSYLLACRWMDHLMQTISLPPFKGTKNDQQLNKRAAQIPHKCSDIRVLFPAAALHNGLCFLNVFLH